MEIKMKKVEGLRRPFYIQTTPVTQAEWIDVMGHNTSHPMCLGNNLPVNCVSWDAVQHFIQKLSVAKPTLNDIKVNGKKSYK